MIDRQVKLRTSKRIAERDCGEIIPFQLEARIGFRLRREEQALDSTRAKDAREPGRALKRRLVDPEIFQLVAQLSRILFCRGMHFVQHRQTGIGPSWMIIYPGESGLKGPRSRGGA